MSSLVIQQYDLGNMGKELGRFLCFFLFLKNTIPATKMGSLSTQAVEKNNLFIDLLSSDNLVTISKITVSFTGIYLELKFYLRDEDNIFKVKFLENQKLR